MACCLFNAYVQANIQFLLPQLGSCSCLCYYGEKIYWPIFLTFPLKQKAFSFFALHKEEGIHDKVTSLISCSLYTASEYIIVFV